MLATYTVEGMTCNHCVHAIKTEVAAIPGVTSVELDLESENLKITSDEAVDFDRVVEAVAEAGNYSIS